MAFDRIILAVALLLTGAAARGEQRVIRFGLTGDYPPFAKYMPDGDLVGADVVIARAAAQAMGARAEFVKTDWAALRSDLSSGRFDVAIGGITILPDRAAIGTFSIPLIEDGKRPLARCREAWKYRSVSAIDRPEVRVQINRGPAIAALAKAWFHHASVTVNADDDDLTAALIQKRTDVWVTDGFVVDHMARRYRGQLCATTRRPFTHQTKAWLIRSDPSLVAAVNAQLARALSSGAWTKALKAVP